MMRRSLSLIDRAKAMTRSQRTTYFIILRMPHVAWFLLILVMPGIQAEAQTAATRTLSGIVVTDRGESVPGASIIVRYASGEEITITDAAGKFTLPVPDEPLTLIVEGKNLQGTQKSIAAGESTVNVQLKVRYVVPPVHESVVI